MKKEFIKKNEPDARLSSSVWIAFFLVLLLTIGDIYLFTTENAFFDSFPKKIVGHLLISVIALFLITALLRNKIDLRYLLVFALFTITLGPPGALTILFSMILYLIFAQITQPLGDLLSSIVPKIELDAADIAYERIIYHLDDFHPDRIPLPFKDIMVFGTYKQKRMAIEKMLRYYRPEFASALKLGLQDKSSAVKVQAATALSYIDHKLFDENIELKKIAEENPDSLEALKAYAEHTRDYVMAEILDPDRKAKMLNNAIKAYEDYLLKIPNE